MLSEYLSVKNDIGEGAKAFIASDDIVTKGVLSTAGSKMLENFVPPFAASAVDRLLDAGYALLGKAKMSEFGLTLLSDELGAHAAGSALLESDAAFALASDAWGQMRVSAAKAGLFGFKASYGYVSRAGLISNAASLETIGVIARNSAALSEALEIIVLQDDADATSVKGDLSRPANKPKIGVAAGIEDEGTKEAAKILADQGYEIIALNAPDIALAKEICDVISCVEFASMAARYDGVKFGYRADSDELDEMYKNTRAAFGEEAKKRILLGTTYTREKYYEDYAVKAMRLRRVLKESVSAILGSALWLLPAMDSEDLYKYTRLANLCGFPAAVMPLGGGFSAQLMGAHGADAPILGALCMFVGGAA